jgi:hypothetical protein
MLLLVALLQAVAPLAVERTGVFASPRVRESSGVAVSEAHPGLVWTINDSGDGPYLYATDQTGADRGAVRVPHADAVDWEELGRGPCPAGPGACLFAGDIGDNALVRPTVTVYAVPEPAPPTGPADTTGTTAAPAVLQLRYPDGPHDVEALFVTPDGALYLITKGRSGVFRVFRVPRGAWADEQPVTAEALQTLPRPANAPARRLVTGAAIAPSGRRVAVRTYAELWFFDLGSDGSLTATGAPCDVRGLEPQGEAVAFLDERRLLLTSEAGIRGAGPMHVVTCPP